MPRTITYYYPDENNPSSVKVFQDRSSQIRGFFFKRDYLKEVAKEAYATNYAVYFLFSDEADTKGIKPFRQVKDVQRRMVTIFWGL